MEETIAEEYKNKILQLVASALLCDHMGDMWDDLNKVLEDIGEKELANADHEYEESEDEDESEGNSEIGRMLEKRGITTVWGSKLGN